MYEHTHPHSHAHDRREQGRARLGWMLALSAAYLVAEVAGGLWTGSLALLADAGHMLSDVASLALANATLWMAQRPADARRTFGHTRAEVLGALVQGTALVAVALLIVREAFERFAAPAPVAGGGMLAIATGGLVVNLVGLWVLHGGREENLAVRGAFLHVLSDALGSVGAMAAGLAIWARGWTWADPTASVAIAALVLVSAWSLLRDATDVLMETVPRHLDVERIRDALRSVDDVADVHDLHVWTIGSGEVSLSCHAVARAGADGAALLERFNRLLADRFRIVHATIQIEPARGPSGLAADVGCTSACSPAARPDLSAAARRG
ncbi:MAG: cation transporter [Myxococcales bacterium]|nr:cation transporter [Myxococcales bacterium]